MPEKRPRGVARVAFLAHLDTIKTELAQGWTARAIYDRLKGKLDDAISYQHFARYCAQVSEGLPIGPRASARGARTRPPAVPTPPPVSEHQQGQPPHGRPQPQPRRTFEYDPSPQPDDKERLIGPRASDKK